MADPTDVAMRVADAARASKQAFLRATLDILAQDYRDLSWAGGDFDSFVAEWLAARKEERA